MIRPAIQHQLVILTSSNYRMKQLTMALLMMVSAWVYMTMLGMVMTKLESIQILNPMTLTD